MEKQTVQYLPLTCKTALHTVSGGFPFKKDLNIYRGCENGCQYCFALYSHKYMKPEEEQGRSSDGYYDHIYVKKNIVAQLDKELSRPGRKKEAVNIGGFCDSYQRAEADYELMPAVLRVMLKHKMPIIISTKSDFILRDFDLIDELSKHTYVNIAATITTADERLRAKIEPGAVSTERRFAMLEKFKKTDASVGIHMMPVLPFLTDSTENLSSVFSKTKALDAEYIIVQTLYLRGQTKRHYLEFIRTEFPDLYEDTKVLYRSGSLDKAYKKNFYSLLNPLLKKYGLSTDYMKPVREGLGEIKEPKQSTLFQF